MKKVFFLLLTTLLFATNLQAEDNSFFVKNSFTSPIVSIDFGVNPYHVFVSGKDGRLMIINNKNTPHTIYDNYIHSGTTLDVSLSRKNGEAPVVILAHEPDGYKIFVLKEDKRKTIPIPAENGTPKSIQYTEDGESFYIYGPDYNGITFYNGKTLIKEPYLSNLENYSFDYIHTGQENNSEKLFGYSKNTLHISVANYKLIRSIDAENSPENIVFRSVNPGFTALHPVKGNQILALRNKSLYLLRESDFSVIRKIPIKLEGKPLAIKGSSAGDQFIVIFEKKDSKYFVRGTILKDRILFEEGKKFQLQSEINATYWGANALWIGSKNGELLFLEHHGLHENIAKYPYKKLIAIEDIDFKDSKELSLFIEDDKVIPLKIGSLIQNNSMSPVMEQNTERESQIFLFAGKGALLNLSRNRLKILTKKGNDFIFQKEMEINPLVEKALFLGDYLYTLHHTKKGATITQISLEDGTRKGKLTSLPLVYGFFVIETPDSEMGEIVISGRTREGENRLYFIDKENNETPILIQGGVAQHKNIPLLIDTTTTENKKIIYATGFDGKIYSLVFNNKKELRCTRMISLTKFGQLPLQITTNGKIIATLNKDHSLSLFNIREKQPIATIYIFSEEKWIAVIYKDQNGKLTQSIIASHSMNDTEIDKVIRLNNASGRD